MTVVSTYNIHRCIGVDGNLDTFRIMNVIKEINADIIGLQEVDRLHEMYDSGTTLHELAEQAGYSMIMGPTMEKDYGHYGNALLSRFEIEDYNTIDISIKGREPRGAIDAVIKADTGEVRVIATHLGLSIRERKQQIKILIDTVCSGSSSRMILMGDINEWSPFASCLRRAGRYFISISKIRTFPSAFPVLALDRIWITSDLKASSITAHKSSTSRIASDHLPLKAVIGAA